MLALLAATALAATPPTGSPAAWDRITEAARVESHTPGVAVALIENGTVVYTHAFGQAAADRPLHRDTIMYGASITKAVFSSYVMMLVDEGKLTLDAPIASLLPKPLPEYDKYKDLADDPRWAKITPRMLLTHSSGFANFRFLEPDGKLHIHFEPGARYAYSGEGINLLQFAIETGLGVSVGAELKRRIFDPLGMTRTSLTWRPDFAPDFADGMNADGRWLPHDQRGSVRAAGSMDTTVDDLSMWVAAVVGGRLLSPKARAEMLRGQLALAGAHQFPTFPEGPNADRDRFHAMAALGWIAFEGPQGKGFYKGGHDDQTDNALVCLEAGRRCLLILTNSGVGARMFPTLTASFLGDAGVPWGWEYNPVLALKP